ncbi:copper radical oxidase [Drepanopeziza brunnea f. sp. 'multigermtubi' MB_m1]|uniref:Copper radical oxidase n=1 Tax=Marssonina brunnea f. sp. multigermtubi (strain MB_m1) TaxID=1072389 RepID=K1XJM8_MARBU|nr:copper radical oxidase [Drepanopeziza brunnea f. sp. 'multigermtubi' MB_m1]EKD12599.1 copper radical oxidase [Drepanopeziza brunnea f. sp. 'multigermtubi' MB_m1]
MGNFTYAVKAAVVASLLTSSFSAVVVEKRQSVVTGWTYYGCQTEGTNVRALAAKSTAYDTMTLESCASDCAGYTYFGTEYGRECYCGNAFGTGSAIAPAADCSFSCRGNSAEKCGAGNRLSVYTERLTGAVSSANAGSTTKVAATTATVASTQPAGPGPQKSDIPAGDNIPAKENGNIKLSVLPYKVWDTQTNDPVSCITRCQQFGFNAAGLEYSSQCFCGDIQNLQVASAPTTSTNPNDVQQYTYSALPLKYADSVCNALCSGNKNYYCGSGNRLTYYTWTTSPVNWAIPTGNAGGKYSLLIGGVVVPLIVSQAITGKVTFLEKAGTGEPNGTGAYELDLTQINTFSIAWRQMTGLKTDVFCAAGLTLPDKAGRQITVGGWAGTSNYGIRLYWPDGSAGVKGTQQWTEDPNNLQLLVPRWYPSAMIMANGSILVVGGEIGQNADQQPNLEILPRTGGGTVYLDFLQRTHPFNLYPFIMVVPSGIFILYYNEARILDEKTFATVKILPNLPGAVNDATGGRTYQLQGSMVALPQYAPFTAPVGVLACGGSTSNGGYAIDNCVSTQPEAANPAWTIERMPSRRVLPCMAGLPDGTYLITGGGQHGVAGFGLGGAPNLNAVLYDPSKPVNQRMSVMANTTVARLYHSEAITLLDGRVMISGSDPTGDYNSPQGSWPEEYRVEVFTPPYLLSGLARPTFTIATKDWQYGAAYAFALTSGSTANLKVSLLGSVSSTHGNSMGQRTLFPAVSCSGATCSITAPPNSHVCPPGWYMLFVLDGPTPSVGQFVRIGGDPASLGNWPKLAGFNLPGV